MNYQVIKESCQHGYTQPSLEIHDFRTLAEAEKFLEIERTEVLSKYEIDDDFDEHDRSKGLKLFYSDGKENSYEWAYYYYLKEVPDRILCAAIHYQCDKKGRSLPVNIDSGIVILGRGHLECDLFANDFCTDKCNEDVEEMDGFLTVSNRFVNRTEAFQIAKSAGQLLSFVGHDKKYLYAGDIFYFD
jgi:hypothetical protein